MNSNNGFKKLALRCETLRTLSGGDLDAANGGVAMTDTVFRFTATVGDKTAPKLNDTVFHLGDDRPRFNDTLAHPGQLHVGKWQRDDTLGHPTQNGKPIPL